MSVRIPAVCVRFRPAPEKHWYRTLDGSLCCDSFVWLWWFMGCCRWPWWLDPHKKTILRHDVDSFISSTDQPCDTSNHLGEFHTLMPADSPGVLGAMPLGCHSWHVGDPFPPKLLRIGHLSEMYCCWSKSSCGRSWERYIYVCSRYSTRICRNGCLMFLEKCICMWCCCDWNMYCTTELGTILEYSPVHDTRIRLVVPGTSSRRLVSFWIL
jgi:hypothetical protein